MRWNIEAVLDPRARWSREKMVRVARTRRATLRRARDGMVNFLLFGLELEWCGFGKMKVSWRGRGQVVRQTDKHPAGIVCGEGSCGLGGVTSGGARRRSFTCSRRTDSDTEEEAV